MLNLSEIRARCEKAMRVLESAELTYDAEYRPLLEAITDLPDCVAEIERLRAELSDTSMRLHTTETATYIMRLALKKACRRIPGRRFGKRYSIMKAMKQVANSNDIGEDENS